MDRGAALQPNLSTTARAAGVPDHAPAHHPPAAGQAGFVANMSDIAPRHAGLLFGLCNTFGSFAGILGVSGEHL